MTRAGQVCLYLPNHPLAQRNGNVVRSRVILHEKVGPGPLPCHWCGRTIEWMVDRSSCVVVDHLDHDWTNDDPDNLVPSCWGCNTSRKRTNVQPGEPFLLGGDGRKKRTYPHVCPFCGRSFMGIPSRKHCSHTCANRARWATR